jgi:hypothetical protein
MDTRCSGLPISLFAAPGNRPDSGQASVRNRETRQFPVPEAKHSLFAGNFPPSRRPIPGGGWQASVFVFLVPHFAGMQAAGKSIAAPFVAPSTRIFLPGQQYADTLMIITWILRTIIPLLVLMQASAALSASRTTDYVQQAQDRPAALDTNPRPSRYSGARSAGGFLPVAASTSSTPDPTYLRTHGILVIESGNAIYSVRADGSDRKLLVSPGFMPSWTPDGRIIFTSPRSGSPQIWIMDADGSNPRQLSRLTSQGVPAMAQMGLNGLIVFMEVRGQWEENPIIWVMRRDGSGLSQIARGGQPFLARSGTWLSYTYETDNPYHRQIWRINTDGTGKKQLTFLGDPDYPDANASSISPDEKWIAFFSGKESDKGEAGMHQDPATWGYRNVAIMPAGGGARLTLTHCLPLQKRRGNECVAADNPTWSPDGQWILHDTDRGGIWMININGKQEQQLYPMGRGTVRIPLRYD